MDQNLEDKKNQFFGFVIILLIIGFLNYFRKVMNGLMLSRVGKILYLFTMITFVVGIMFVLYFTDLNNIFSFMIGLMVTALSENIAKLFLILSDKFNPIVVKIFKVYLKLDLTTEFSGDIIIDNSAKEEAINNIQIERNKIKK